MIILYVVIVLMIYLQGATKQLSNGLFGQNQTFTIKKEKDVLFRALGDIIKV